ncbi:MAG TPA: hypothetical protein VMW24_10095 [Sedimentisphaerales bacterium]|jgi:hypothetical protein|nr:hypothetical protein [Sedimentisphaerales bacterium]
MKTLSKYEFETLETPLAGTSIKNIGQVQRCIKTITGMFRSRFDLNYLNSHLRRDTRIDELELERKRIVNAPLIR